MRERTTWQGNGRMATSTRRAAEEGQDIYSMNYDGPRPQPGVTEYENGSPASWNETPVSADKMSVNAEYEGGHVKRNELGFGEFRDDTHKRPKWGEQKYDNARLSSERKATAAHRLASALLRTEDRAALRKVAVSFMGLSDGAIRTALNAVESTQPAALSDESRFKRALACTKIAARMLGDEADEPVVERLARAMYNIDDPTLKSIVSIVATAQIAAEGKSEGKSGSGESGSGASGSGKSMKSKTSAKKEEASGHSSGHSEASGKSEEKKTAAKGKKPAFLEEGEKKKTSTEKMDHTSSWSSKSGKSSQKMDDKKHQAEEECYASDEESGHSSGNSALTAEMKKMVSEMMKEHAEKSEAPGSGMFGAPAGESNGMSAPAPAPMGGESMPPAPAPAPAPMGMGQMAMSISFEDDGEPMQVHTAALEALFSDDPEVKAQRELTAAAKFNPARVASTGAKKLGSVRATPAPAPEASLAALWDRP